MKAGLYLRKFRDGGYVDKILDTDRIVVITSEGREIEIILDEKQEAIQVRATAGAINIRPEVANSIKISVTSLFP